MLIKKIMFVCNAVSIYSLYKVSMGLNGSLSFCFELVVRFLTLEVNKLILPFL